MTTSISVLEFDGARIHCEIEGQGDPIVFVHAGIADLRMWDPQVAALRGAYRCIRYDTRGYGATETDAVEFSNRADLGAVLDHAGAEAAHVVGLSRGAQIALDFALDFPDRVRSLTFAAGGIGGYDAPEEFDPSTFDEPEHASEAKDWEALADWETRFWVDGPGQPPDRVDPAMRAMVHAWILDTYRAEKEEGTPRPLDPPAGQRLDGLSVPLLVIVGSLDEPGTRAACRHLADTIPGARLEVFDGAAHMLNLEQPDRFNALLTEFLAGVSAP